MVEIVGAPREMRSHSSRLKHGESRAMPPYFKESPLNPNRNLLTPIERERLILIGQGFSYPQIAERDGVSVKQIKNNVSGMKDKFRRDPYEDVSTIGLLRRVLDKGEIVIDEIVPPGFDPKVFSRLTDSERAVVEGILNGKVYKEIAFERDVSERTVRNNAYEMFGKIGARNPVSTAVLFWKARELLKQEVQEKGEDPGKIDVFAKEPEKIVFTPRQIQVLELEAKGLTTRQIAFELGLSYNLIKNVKAGIGHKLGLDDFYPKDVVVKAIQLGLIDTSALVHSDFDPSIFQNLNPAQLAIIRALIENLSVGEIGQKTEKARQTVKNNLAEIRQKVGVKTTVELAVYYLEAQRRAKVAQSYPGLTPLVEDSVDQHPDHVESHQRVGIVRAALSKIGSLSLGGK